MSIASFDGVKGVFLLGVALMSNTISDTLNIFLKIY